MSKRKSFARNVGLSLMLLSILFTIFVQPKSLNAEGIDNVSIYLSEIEWESAISGQGELPQKDASADGGTITLTDNNRKPVEFEKGIGIHANSEIVYDVSGLDYKYLTTWVGVDSKTTDPNASIQFKIYVDDELKYKSKAMKHTTPMEYVRVHIQAAQKLKLVVDSENGNASSYGDWANTQLHFTDPVISNTEDIKEYENMRLIFNDEFDSAEIDNEKWALRTTPENGTHHYANVVGEGENIWVKDGNLHIQAKKYEGDGNFSSTSGAISTENKFDFRYGRVDVRAKIPSETGMWPAIWMMPANPDYGWPMAGEIDIMELISQQPNRVWSTVHSGVYNTSYYFNGGSTLTIDRGTYYDDYHVYSLEWEPDRLSFYVDDQLVAEIRDWKNWVIDSESGDIKEREYPAPFNRNFYLILNVATGGGWAENVNETTRWGDRTTMKVDYVRVYQKEHPISSVTDLKELVEYYDAAGDFTATSKRALGVHLTALELYEQKGEEEKVVKHLKGLNYLLDHQKKEGQIFDEAYKALTSGADRLIDQLE
ncbi:NPCBM/NEW2 domain-containing protein [Bacillus niameyensis]|uniref:NPCBM/NEW2 domain-containing protein n=1 Tax=Bacillus niameyensis TaxID=1522308 RepID=UPI000780CD35|nr:NPCBM/NEW2 domain-containing protein [Bacillus niameyensis]